VEVVMKKIVIDKDQICIETDAMRTAIAKEVEENLNGIIEHCLKEGAFLCPDYEKIGIIRWYLDTESEIYIEESLRFIETQLLDFDSNLRNKWAEEFERMAAALRK
jgi:hypothetical protein